MSRLRNISGYTCAKILCNNFGFSLARTKGSHCILTKLTTRGKIGTVVPLHSELKIGTLRSILFQAGISEEDFERYI